MVCFTVLAPVFSFTAPTLETGLVLVVLMIVAFQVMRTVLKVFAGTGTLIRRVQEKHREKENYLLQPWKNR